MIHSYQLHPLSKLYREETLREARVRHLVCIGRKCTVSRERKRKSVSGRREGLGVKQLRHAGPDDAWPLIPTQQEEVRWRGNRAGDQAG